MWYLRVEYYHPDFPHAWKGRSQHHACHFRGQCPRVFCCFYPASQHLLRIQVAASQHPDVHFVMLNVTASSPACLVNRCLSLTSLTSVRPPNFHFLMPGPVASPGL